MKKYDKIKTVQLFIYLAVSVTGLTIIFTNNELYTTIAENRYVGFFFALLWLLVITSLIFMIIDFKAIHHLKKSVSELDLLVYSDPVSGLANRYSCDAIIEKYLDQPLPKGIGCISFALVNLREINQTYSHYSGNIVIKAFSSILSRAAATDCFVGRNGGDKFLALFTSCSDAKMASFIKKVEAMVEEYNSKATRGTIEFKYGMAFNEGEEVADISALIALSNRRVIEKYRTFVER